MLLIPCPWCGPRAETEFSCAGEARTRVAGGEGLDAAAWADRLHGRDNLRGESAELWWHVHGCQQWLLVRRDTLTHTVHSAAPAMTAMADAAAGAGGAAATAARDGGAGQADAWTGGPGPGAAR
jgi:sarcosine oxidase subunit delta